MTLLDVPGYPSVLKVEMPDSFAGAIKLAVSSAISRESGEGAIAKNKAVVSGRTCFE